MTLLTIVAFAAVVLGLAYLTYGRLLARLVNLDPSAKTPAEELRDERDFVPTDARFLMGQHFSAIAAAGPIVGPILAGLYFGWLPALLWILVGSILIGGVHDFMSLVASIRHRARSIAEVVREHVTPRSYVLFLVFIWFALVYIIVAFTDITALSFVGVQTLENGERVTGAGIAASSALYMVLPVIMGLLMRFLRMPLWLATLVFVPLVGLSIVVGPMIPLDIAAWFALSQDQAHKAWDVVILVYCVLAALSPVWLLLQPRGHLGGIFLYAALGIAVVGLVISNKTVQYPAFTGFQSARGGDLFPMLFITVACGACSGFHALIASGTTSKQLRRETDAKPIGYGTMLLEGLVATVALGTLMMLAPSSGLVTSGTPNLIYANGVGSFMETLGVSKALAMSFALMAFTTFVFDTLDVCTRLGRYILVELTGWRTALGSVVATVITAGVPLMFVMRTATDAAGKPIPAWRMFWSLFGSANQLLAALALLGITVWLWRTRRAAWVWLVAGLPTAWMYTMSVWALVTQVRNELAKGAWSNPVPWVGVVLLVLAGLVLIEAVVAFFGRPGTGKQVPVGQPG